MDKVINEKYIGCFLVYFFIEYLSYLDGSQEIHIGNVIRLHTALTATVKTSVYFTMLATFIYVPILIEVFRSKMNVQRCSIYIVSRTCYKGYIKILLRENGKVILEMVGLKLLAEIAICFDEIWTAPGSFITLLLYNLNFAMNIVVIALIMEIIHLWKGISYRNLFSSAVSVVFLLYFFLNNYLRRNILEALVRGDTVVVGSLTMAAMLCGVLLYVFTIAFAEHGKGENELI